MIANSLMWGLVLGFFFNMLLLISYPMVTGSNSCWALDTEGKMIIC